MNVVYNILAYLVWFLATYWVVLLLLIVVSGKEKLFEKKKFTYKNYPRVSVAVPAFNEEKKISFTIKSLKRIKYKNMEFIIINDGSSDKTSQVVTKTIAGDSRFVFIDRKENKGKAASLNEAISIATGKFVATMDADSVVEPNIFMKVLPHFENKKTAAVTVSVAVKNPKTFLHKIFDLEYIVGLSLFLKLFSLVDAVFVTPGPFSIYRTSAIKEIGGFDENNITEDLEIAYRLQKARYKIDNCLDAKVYTIIPPKFKDLCIQRKRWYSGAIQTLMKHNKMIGRKKYGTFGYFVLFNYSLIFLGMILFIGSLYLGATNIFNNLIYISQTNFNFLEQLKYLQFDILATGQISLLGFIALGTTMLTAVVGLVLTKTKISEKKLGLLGYPLLFFLYQFFWILSVVAVIRGKKIKWR